MEILGKVPLEILGKHQQGLPWGVRPSYSSLYLLRMAVAYLLYRLDISCEVCKGLTKCLGSKVHLVVSSKFYESVEATTQGNIEAIFSTTVIST